MKRRRRIRPKVRGKYWVVATVVVIFSLFLVFILSKQEEKGVTTKSAPATTTTTKSQVDPQIYTLSLEKIFGTRQDISKLDTKELVTIVMTGDIIPARHVNAKVVGYGDFTHPYLKTADYVKNADLTVTDLEAPLVTGCKVVSGGMSFCGDPRHVQGLNFAGIDVASVANNHFANYGSKGVNETLALLRENGIEPAGRGNMVLKTVKGIKFAFLGYNGVEDHFEMDIIKSDISDARKLSDVVVVMPHWGKEYVRIPASDGNVAPEDPKVIARKMIDYGADVILGNHPHWYQGVEIYKNRLIAYAHGNFVFDQEWSVETTQGVVGKYTFYKGKLVDVVYKPILIADYNQPYFLSPELGDVILKTMRDNSWE